MTFQGEEKYSLSFLPSLSPCPSSMTPGIENFEGREGERGSFIICLVVQHVEGFCFVLLLLFLLFICGLIAMWSEEIA